MQKVMLSEHFGIEELTRSQAALRRGIDNTPNDAQVMNLRRLCTYLLEPARVLLACPLHIDSGFRTPEVNHAVGSTAAHSAHLDGRAADFVPVGVELRVAFDDLRSSSLPIDQLILECGSWLHIAVAPVGLAPRREFLLAHGKPGDWRYTRA